MGFGREDKDFARNRVLIDALDAEVDRRRGFVAQRTDALTTKASILIASASLVTALQSAKTDSGWIGFAIGLSALAAVLGIAALMPRVGNELDLIATERNLWGDADVRAIRNLTSAKREVLQQDEHALFWRAIVVTSGFACLAAALVIAGLVFLNAN